MNVKKAPSEWRGSCQAIMLLHMEEEDAFWLLHTTVACWGGTACSFPHHKTSKQTKTIGKVYSVFAYRSLTFKFLFCFLVQLCACKCTEHACSFSQNFEIKELVFPLEQL